jgi:hypothetical protein
MKCLMGNYFFQFAMPLIIFIINWRTLKNNNIYMRLLISFVCMLTITIIFFYLITTLNIDRPFDIGSPFLAL